MISISGKTYIITGASRGIGRAMAIRLAREGANVVLAAKTVDDSEQKLKGTIHEVAAAAQDAGGQALALQVDVRDEEAVAQMVTRTMERFGAIDGLINNAGAIMLQPVAVMPVKRFDLLWQVNVRAAYLTAHHCIPHLKRSDNPHIISMSPPISPNTHWLSGKTGYTITKYGMTLLTFGLAEELAADGIAVNSLWPKTTIATAAVEWIGGQAMMRQSRKPEMIADAVHAIVTTPSRDLTGKALIDEEVLRERGVTDFEPYAVEPGQPLLPDFYVD